MAGSRTLKLSILADVADLKKNLDTGSKEVEGFGGKLEKFGKVAAAAFAAAAAAAAAYAVKNFILTDISTFKERYNKFLFDEGATDAKTLEVGEHEYRIYAQISSNNLNPTLADELVVQQDDASNLESNIRWFIESKNNELFKQLQDEYEHLTSEESFLESCEANEVTFNLENDDEVCN